jgi:hypothetical protein
MNADQAYCLNFLVLTSRWGRGVIASAAAWALSVLGIAMTAAAAWLIGERLSIGPVPINLAELSGLEFYVAMVATVLSYLRFFRFVLGAASARQRSELLDRRTGRAAFAVVALVGPIVVAFIIVITNS